MEKKLLSQAKKKPSSTLSPKAKKKTNSTPSPKAKKKPSSSPSPKAKKKPRLSLSLRKNRRFHPVSTEEVRDLKTKQIPKNTEASSKWAIKNLRDWYTDYNERNPDCKCPDSILSPSCTKEELNKWLTVFISETRNHNGENYPPKSLYAIVTGILRSMRLENPNYPNILDKHDTTFLEFQTALDNMFKQLRQRGIGAESIHTESISLDEENQLWSCGVLSVDHPKGLIRCVFYYNGKCFCLKGWTGTS
jgi:hypothetical protein